MVRWGILGAGNIAHRFARSLSHVEGARLVAVSCRSAQKAASFAQEFGLDPARAYSDEALGAAGAAHEALLADSQVDAIYLALPHDLHHDWAIRALRAGKAVLCEKPACLNAAQVEDVARVAQETGCLFMEGMKSRFTPAYRAIRTAVDAGEIGTVTAVRTSLCNDMRDVLASGKTYHSQPLVGGVLLDCGIYCAGVIDDFLPEGDTELAGFAGMNGDQGVETYVDADLRIAGCTATLECAFDRAKPRTATIEGTLGRIVVEELHRPQWATVYAFTSNGFPYQTRVIDLPYEVDDFYGEADHFTRLVEAGTRESPVVPLSSSVRMARILDVARTGLAVTPQSLATLEAQERALRYPAWVHFGSNKAFELGCIAMRLSKEYDRGVSVRVTRESDGLVMFEWAADDKAPRNQAFMEGKRQASLETGHSSLWAWVAHELGGRCRDLFDRMMAGPAAATPEKPYACVAAGAFPIWVATADGGVERVATLAVSGLHEGRDHEVAVRALSEALNLRYGTDVPAYRSLAK